MSTAVQSAADLKPEVRLGLEISEYQCALDDEEKTNFRELQVAGTPQISDVITLTEQISRKHGQCGGHSVGPRVTNVLEAVQRFSTVVDTIVDGSHSFVGSAIWGVLKTALLITSVHKTYFESLSFLFMKVGKKSLIYEEWVSLFESPGLRKALCEYFTLVVVLCKQAVMFLKKGLLKQLSASIWNTPQTELGHFEIKLGSLADMVNSEAQLAAIREQKREIQEASGFRSRMRKVYQENINSVRRKNKAQYLDACSKYDYMGAWKQARKAGSSSWLYEKSHYKQWLCASSGTLLITGILGSGKSVLSANLIAHLVEQSTTPATAVCYFFCRHDDLESLTARTILGSLIRQMLFHAPPEIFDTVSNWQMLPAFGAEQILKELRELLPLNKLTQSYYIVIDGLDECDPNTVAHISMNLAKLVEASGCKVVCTCRPDTGRRQLLPLLRPAYRVQMDVHGDLRDFIDMELEQRLHSGDLSIGNPDTILRIRQALVDGSYGMFLWVTFQIDAICTETTDDGILTALQSLPKDLPETFNRILQRLKRDDRQGGRELHTEIFGLLSVAQRPLTIDELGEALSVVAGKLTWDESRLVNDMHKTLSHYCGSLVFADEEYDTVHLIHPCVKQHLFNALDQSRITLTQADHRMGEICVTYLNFPDHEKQLVPSRGRPRDVFRSKYIPAQIVNSFSGAVTNALAAQLLRRAHGLATEETLTPKSPEVVTGSGRSADIGHAFLDYATKHWMWHSRSLDSTSLAHALFRRLIQGKVSFVPQPWTIRPVSAPEETALVWAASHGHEALLKLLLEQRDANINETGDWGATLLGCAAGNGHESVVRLLTSGIYDVDVNQKDKAGRTPIWLAVCDGHSGCVDILLDTGKVDAETGDSLGRTPLERAASMGHEGIVRRLLTVPGVKADSRDRHGRSPLQGAADGGFESVVHVLLEREDVDVASADEHGNTPLSVALMHGHSHVAEILELRMRTLDLPIEIDFFRVDNPSEKVDFSTFMCELTTPRGTSICRMEALSFRVRKGKRQAEDEGCEA